MSDVTPSRFAQINGGGATDAIFLKVFANEVLKTFQETNVMKPLHSIRSIQSGKSAAFPVIGTAAASYHVPGTELTGAAILSAEKIISIDALLTSHVWIADIDEAMSHFDIRAPYANALGRALALKYDKQCLQVAVLAARASANISGGNGGSVLTNAAFDNDGEALAEGIFDAAQALDEKDVPEEERYMVVRPKHYHLMSRSTKVLNRDWGGKGVYSDGKVFRVAGVNIVKSNNVPNSIIAPVTGENNTYGATFTNTVGVLFHREAIGTVELMGLGMEKERSARHQSNFVVAKMAVGHGPLRPECSVEFAKA